MNTNQPAKESGNNPPSAKHTSMHPTHTQCRVAVSATLKLKLGASRTSSSKIVAQGHLKSRASPRGPRPPRKSVYYPKRCMGLPYWPTGYGFRGVQCRHIFQCHQSCLGLVPLSRRELQRCSIFGHKTSKG